MSHILEDNQGNRSHWSIYVAADKLETEKFDNIIFGKSRAHSFLLLVDEDNQKVIKELHGTSFDLQNDAINVNGGRKPLNLVGVVASSLDLKDQFMKSVCALGLDDRVARLYVKEVDGRREYDEIEGYPIVSGAKAQMRSMWEDICRVGEKINKVNEPFIPFSIDEGGQNCHSATLTMLNEAGLEVIKERFEHYALPGIMNRINLDDVPEIDFEVHDM